jgi:hypothetical protein
LEIMIDFSELAQLAFFSCCARAAAPNRHERHTERKFFWNLFAFFRMSRIPIPSCRSVTARPIESMGVIVAFFRASYFARAGSGGVKYFSTNYRRDFEFSNPSNVLCLKIWKSSSEHAHRHF